MLTGMRNILLFSFLLASCSNGPRELPVVSPEAAGLSSESLGKAGTVLEKAVEEGRIAGGLIAVARDGKMAWVKTAGRMDREAGKPVRPDTIWRIYSMTKAIVTAAALILVEEGRVGLDDPVAKHVPELAGVKVWTPEGLRPPKRPPTVKDLMLHTAGYRYGGGPQGVADAYREKKPLEAETLDDMAARLREVPLAFDPGTDWVYGISIDVVGLVIERASGVRLDRFLQERVFDPLDMRDTGFFVPAEKIHRFAANYRTEKDGLKLMDAPATSRYAKPPTFHSGGGGLVSTARDYVRFLQMVMNGGTLHGTRILRPETVRLMTTNQLPEEAFPIYFGKQVRHGTGFGLGFSVSTADTDWDPQGRVGECGWGGAASTHYWFSPRDRLIVVTMEQRMPYTFETEFAVKGLIYQSLR